jgi:hypothetical protein
LPIPPIEGLQLISPRESMRWVKRIVWAPDLAEAAAASHPACPPPIIHTSAICFFNLSILSLFSTAFNTVLEIEE